MKLAVAELLLRVQVPGTALDLDATVDELPLGGDLRAV
jgi:hypothetical protein